MKKTCTEGTVADVVVQYPELRPLLERLGIDYCCGGKVPFAEAAAKAGHKLEDVLLECSRIRSEATAGKINRDWSKATVTELAQHILDTHHVFTKAQLPRVNDLLSRIQRAHGESHGAELTKIRQVFDLLRDELDSHLEKEEQILFPAILAIDGFIAGRNGRPAIHCGKIAYPIQQMEHEHDNAGDCLKQLRILTNDYQAPPDTCPTYVATFEALAELEADLHEHIHLENNILFPASIRQEEEIAQ
ncbi:MAG: iron-sulfur cluster repair di-iron protein [Lentisphaerae bacterium]|jgi:regulator of cell morphogenesis and NO signaling|nr:iron-sulfur cluster repair di-iron protein [Lentisphaerota bacterium]